MLASVEKESILQAVEETQEKTGLKSGEMNTMSVVITQNRILATQIYNLARQYGKANIYFGFPKYVEDVKEHAGISLCLPIPKSIAYLGLKLSETLCLQ
jgi:hypothetical protein